MTSTEAQQLLAAARALHIPAEVHGEMYHRVSINGGPWVYAYDQACAELVNALADIKHATATARRMWSVAADKMNEALREAREA